MPRMASPAGTASPALRQPLAQAFMLCLLVSSGTVHLHSVSVTPTGTVSSLMVACLRRAILRIINRMNLGGWDQETSSFQA